MQAAGRMGLTEMEFELTTPRYFFNARKGWKENEQAKWERSRMVALNSMAPHLNRHEMDNAKRRLTFPWEAFHIGPAMEQEMARQLEEDCRREWGETWKQKRAEA